MQWFKFDPTVVGTIVEDLDLSGQGAYFKLMRSLWVFGPLSEAEVRRKCGPTFEQLRELMCPVGECLSFAWLEALRSEGQHVSDVRAAAATVRHSKQKEPSDVQLHANAMQLPSMSISTSSSKSQGRKERASEPIEAKVIPMPFTSEAFALAWADWELSRREIKKPLTATSRKAQLAKCLEWGESRAIAALRHSTAGGYQGIYEPTNRTTNGPVAQSQTERDQELARIVAARYAGQ